MYREPGVSFGNGGASGEQYKGLVPLNFNERPPKSKLHKCTQDSIDYICKNQLILEGMKVSSMPARIAIRVLFSTVGATGSGSMYWFLGGGIKSCASQDGFKPKSFQGGCNGSQSERGYGPA